MVLRRLGQSIIEYSALFALLFAAILVGGPVLKRSLFGYFKIQEDSITDSLSEEILQTDTSSMMNCTCNGTPVARSCGAAPCSANERLYETPCTPSVCGISSDCQEDSSCCTSSVSLGSCGQSSD